MAKAAGQSSRSQRKLTGEKHFQLCMHVTRRNHRYRWTLDEAPQMLAL